MPRRSRRVSRGLRGRAASLRSLAPLSRRRRAQPGQQRQGAAPAAQEHGRRCIIAAEADGATSPASPPARERTGSTWRAGPSDLRDLRERLKGERALGVGGIRTKDDAMRRRSRAPITSSSASRGRRFLPALEAVVERAAWWAEIFETPCVVYAPRLEACRRSPPTRAEFVALGDAVWSHPGGPAAAVAQAAPWPPGRGGRGLDARLSGPRRRLCGAVRGPCAAARARSRLWGLSARPLHHGLPRSDEPPRKEQGDAAAKTLLGELYNQGLGVPGSREGRRMVPARSRARRRQGALVARPDGARRPRHAEEPGPGPRLARAGGRERIASRATIWRCSSLEQ